MDGRNSSIFFHEKDVWRIYVSARKFSNIVNEMILKKHRYTTCLDKKIDESNVRY
jgi:hypothetical protein